MINLQRVEKYYDNGKGEKIHALQPTDLTIEAGEIYGVIGKSGAGKSTLIRCVNLLEPPSSGKVFVDNQELTALSPKELRQARHHIAMIFQHFNLLNSKTVYDNIAFPLHLLKKSPQEIESTVLPLLELTGLQDKKQSYPSQLSGGQKQRVGIARALATNPKVLLCDEATSALDPQTTKAILELLKDINHRLNLTILLITHEMDVVKQICHKIALIDKGKIIENATILDFFTKPQTQQAKCLVNATMRKKLPDALKAKIKPQSSNENHNPIIRIYFFGAATKEPLIAHLIKNIGIDINILQANVEVVANETIGVMTAEIIAQNGNFNQAMDYLKQKNFQVEVLGYV